MASNLKQQFTQQCVGGVVDAIPPDQLNESQLRDALNLVPMESATQLSLRRGIEHVGQSVGAGKIYGIFEKYLSSGDSKLYVARANGTNDIVIRCDDGVTVSTIHTFTNHASSTTRVSFCDWEGDLMFFTDGISGTYACTTSTNTVEQVYDAHKFTKANPTAATVTGGTVNPSSNSYLNLADTNGVYAEITEAAGTPGFTYEVTFSSVAKTTHRDVVQFVGYYAGGNTHYITVQAWDGTAWDDIGRIGVSSSPQSYTFRIDKDQHFLVTNEVKLRFNHTMLGIASHKFYVDSVNLFTKGSYIIGFDHLTQHRGRLWGVKDSSVYFCGTDDATMETDPRYYNWSPSTIDGVTYDDGNYVDIPPFGSNCVATASTSAGLIVFKQKSIMLWTYPDSAAPYEVDKGASLDPIANNIGCVDAESISYDGDVVYFMGIDDSERIGLYRIDGNTVQPISSNVRDYFRRIRSDAVIAGEIIGRRYYVITDNGMTMMYDIALDSWYPMSSPQFYTVTHGNYGNRLMLAGKDGYVWQYPSDLYTDNGSAIPWAIRTRDYTDGAFDEMKVRELYLEAGANGDVQYSYKVYRDEVLVESGDLPAKTFTADKWNDVGDTWDDGDIWGGEPSISRYGVTLNHRGYRFSVGFSGTSNVQVLFNKIGIGYRGRSGKTYVR